MSEFIRRMANMDGMPRNWRSALQAHVVQRCGYMQETGIGRAVIRVRPEYVEELKALVYNIVPIIYRIDVESLPDQPSYEQP